MRIFKPRAAGSTGAKPGAGRTVYVGRIRVDRYEALANDPYVRALIRRATRRNNQNLDKA